MKVLVTGGAGYIGSVTAELLLAGGHEVVVFDNLERGHRGAVARGAQFRRGDLRDRAATLRVLAEVEPDAVMHFAAYALVGESMRDPGMYFANNVAGGINLVDAMVAAGTERIVFSSTCATYGTTSADTISENTPQQPANPYGESKLMLEKVMAWHQTLNALKPVFLRYFNASGATVEHGEDHDPETHLIPNVLRAASGQQGEVTIFGDDYDTPDGTCIRDYVHVADLARAHALALASGLCGGFNLGTGRGQSVREVIRAAEEVTGRPVPVRVGPRRPGDPARLVAAADRARREFGWQPEYEDLHGIVETAWRWLRAHPEGYGK